MPDPSFPPVRVRLHEHGARAIVDAAGERWHATVAPELSRSGAHAIDATVQLEGDRFEGRAAARLDGEGARASGELRTTRGPLAGAVHASLDAGDVNAGADAQARLGDATLGASWERTGAGVTSAAHAAFSLADNAEVRVRATRTAHASALRGALSVRLAALASAPTVDVAAGRETEHCHEVPADDSVVGRVRARMLAARPGARFLEQTVTVDAEAGASQHIPIPVVDARVGATTRKERTVRVTRLCADDAAAHAPPPLHAAALAQLLPGEAVQVQGLARVTANGELGLALRSPIGLGGSVAAHAQDARTVSYGIDVARLDAGDVLVTLLRAREDETEAGHELDVGIALRLPALRALRNPIAHVAADALHAAGNDLLDAVSPLGAERTQTCAVHHEQVCTWRVDLARADARQALDAALAGDWRALEALGPRGGAHPIDNREVETRATTDRHGLHAFGLSRTTTATVASERQTEQSPEGAQHREDWTWTRAVRWGGWLGAGEEELMHEERAHTPVDAGSQAHVDGTLRWTSERTLGPLRPQQLDVALRVASLLGDAHVRADVEAYRARLRTHEQARGRGPDAKLRFAVLVDDDGLVRARALTLETLWERAAAAWSATHPNAPAPLWTREAGRRSLEEHGPLRHGHADYAPYHEVREVLEALHGEAPRHETLRRLRGLIATRSHEAFWVVCVAAIVGAQHTGLVLEVDGQGADDALDFSLAP